MDDRSPTAVRQILIALKRLHEFDALTSIVHGDLKVDNILITEDAEVRIIDLGVSSQVPRREAVGVKTSGVHFGGSPSHCPPESLEYVRCSSADCSFVVGISPVSRTNCRQTSVDIWGLGLVALRLLTGEIPFDTLCETDEDGSLLEKTLEVITNQNYLDILFEELGKVVDSNALSFVRNCLEVDPRKRPTATNLLLHPFVSQKNSRPTKNLKEAYSAAFGWQHTLGKRRRQVSAEVFKTAANRYWNFVETIDSTDSPNRFPIISQKASCNGIVGSEPIATDTSITHPIAFTQSKNIDFTDSDSEEFMSPAVGNSWLTRNVPTKSPGTKLLSKLWAAGGDIFRSRFKTHNFARAETNVLNSKSPTNQSENNTESRFHKVLRSHSLADPVSIRNDASPKISHNGFKIDAPDSHMEEQKESITDSDDADTTTKPPLEKASLLLDDIYLGFKISNPPDFQDISDANPVIGINLTDSTGINLIDSIQTNLTESTEIHLNDSADLNPTESTGPSLMELPPVNIRPRCQHIEQNSDRKTDQLTCLLLEAEPFLPE